MAESVEVIEIVSSSEDAETALFDVIEIEDHSESEIETLKTSKENRSIEPVKESYYQRAFNTILSTVIEVYHQILSPDELKVLNLINDTDKLGTSAKKLFIRLILRRAAWHRVNKMVYEDIPDVLGAARELDARKLCTLDSDSSADYLELLTLPELKQLASSKLFIKMASLQPREEIIRSIMNSKSSGQQRISFSSTDGKLGTLKSNDSKAEIIRQFCGPIVKICDPVRQLVDTVVSLYFLVSENDTDSLSTAILVEINRRAYPKYKIIRNDPIFKTRQDYLEYQRALELEISLKDQVVEDKSIFELVKVNFLNCLHNCDVNRSYFLRRYTAGWVYCRILGQLAASLESLKRYNLAVEIYQFLLNQNLFCLGRRGKWWERSVLDTSRHLKDSQGAMELCEAALKDSHLRTSALTSIKRRLKKLNKGISETEGEEEEPEILTLHGRIQEGNVTGKRVKLHLDGDDLSLGTVEEFVLNEFSLDGWDGIHSESSYFTTIFALIFWDLLFDLAVPDVFQTAYQTAPLDLNTDAFYLQRAEAIELRLKLIEEEFEETVKLIKKHHVTYHKVTCVGVNWNDYAGEEGIEILIKIARGIGGPALSLILRQFCEDYRHNRSGMPDLILWRSSNSISQESSKLIDQANGVIFAEVKSPNDRLSDAQRHWFSVLKSGGMRVILVRVKQ